MKHSVQQGIHSNIQIETNSLKIFHLNAWTICSTKITDSIVLWVLGGHSATQTEETTSETEFMKMGQFFTWGEGLSVCERSVFTGQIELFDFVFYFKMSDPLPSVDISMCCCLGE